MDMKKFEELKTFDKCHKEKEAILLIDNIFEAFVTNQSDIGRSFEIMEYKAKIIQDNYICISDYCKG
jgi:hypothetical protein